MTIFVLPNAGVVKLVDTLDLGSSASRLEGSSPSGAIMTTIEENIMIMHHGCALRQNASSQTISAMAQLGKPFEDAVAAALLTLGGSHGPVRDAQYAYTDLIPLYVFIEQE